MGVWRSLPGSVFLPLITGLAGAMFLLCTPVAAANKTTLTVNETAVGDSNPLMRAKGVRYIWGSETQALLTLLRETPRTTMESRISAIRNQFNDSSFNSTDFHAQNTITKKSPRTTISLRGDIDYDTTRLGEITTFGGRTTENRRLTWKAEPTITYSLSPRSLIALDGSWQERRYENKALTDYRTVSFAPSFSFLLTPLHSLFLSFHAQRYSALGGGRTVDSIGPSAGWQFRFRPSLRLEFHIGFLGSRSDGYGAADGTWTINPVYTGTLSYEGQRNRAELSISRARQPYSNGTESDLTTVSAENEFAITPLWAINMRAAYQQAEQPPLSTGGLDKACEESVMLTYDGAAPWRFSASQNYRREELADGYGEANRNIFRIGLGYRFGAGQP